MSILLLLIVSALSTGPIIDCYKHARTKTEILRIPQCYLANEKHVVKPVLKRSCICGNHEKYKMVRRLKKGKTREGHTENG